MLLLLGLACSKPGHPARQRQGEAHVAVVVLGAVGMMDVMVGRAVEDVSG